MSSTSKSSKNNILVSSNFDTGNIDLEKISYNDKDVVVSVKIRKDVRKFCRALKISKILKNLPKSLTVEFLCVCVDIGSEFVCVSIHTQNIQTMHFFIPSRSQKFFKNHSPLSFYVCVCVCVGVGSEFVCVV